MLDNFSVKFTITSEELEQITENLAIDLNLSVSQFPLLKLMVKQQIEAMLDELVSDLVASPAQVLPSKFLRTVRLYSDDWRSLQSTNLPVCPAHQREILNQSA